MYSRIICAVNEGIKGHPIAIETNLQEGMPQYQIVGLPSRIIQEAKERVRAAISNCNVRFPLMRITQNLSPSQLKKEGVHMDLAIAMGIITAQNEEMALWLSDIAVIGALTLDGRIEKVPGFISLIDGLYRSGIRKMIIPYDNLLDEVIFEGVTFYGYHHLNDLMEDLNLKNLKTNEEPKCSTQVPYKENDPLSCLDFADIIGQSTALRALEIAIAGRHNILFVGPPGCGKTMILKRLTTILSKPTLDERIEISMIHGLSDTTLDVTQVHSRPVVMPHHTITKAAMLGGGIKCLPGEVSKAHRGILALDELGEFRKDVIEVLREPMSTGEIRLTKGQTAIAYPADFQLVATMNPCFCGYYGSKVKTCECSQRQRRLYKEKFSGPILDRIDMIVFMDRVEVSAFDDETHSKLRTSSDLKSQLNKFYHIGSGPTSKVQRPIYLSKEAEAQLKKLYQKNKISMRRFEKIKGIAMTIAILAGDDNIKPAHVYEALLYDGAQFRNHDEVFSNG